MEYITLDEFKKMDIRVGTIKQVEIIPDSDKLLKTTIDFGEKMKKMSLFLVLLCQEFVNIIQNMKN